MGMGEYLHFGLKDQLLKLLEKNDGFSDENIFVEIGIDGLLLSKSSNSQLWPILENVSGYVDVFVIGVYHGYSKPMCSDSFLTKFVEEIQDLHNTGGISFKDSTVKIHIRTIVCDSPAKSFLLQVEGHSGYFGCTKCKIKGEYKNQRVVFPEVDQPLRSDLSFKTRQQVEYHKNVEEIAIERINIGCVSQFPVVGVICTVFFLVL